MLTRKAVLKKPLQTSIAVEVDEFDDIDVEDKLHIVISVKDFRAIINHAGNTGNDLSARYSLPARPIQLTYASDAISCEFLIMTVGERGTNPSQRTKKGGRKSGNAQQSTGPRLEAASRRTSVAPSEAQQEREVQQMPPPASRANPHPTPQLSAARASASRIGAFDLRPTQQVPPPTNQSESLFVEDEGWEPVHDPDDDEDDARLEWDHSADPVSAPFRVQSLKLTLAEPLRHAYEQSRGTKTRRSHGTPSKRRREPPLRVPIPRPNTAPLRRRQSRPLPRLILYTFHHDHLASFAVILEHHQPIVITTHEVAHPAPIVSIEAPFGMNFDEAMTFHRPLTSLFST